MFKFFIILIFSSVVHTNPLEIIGGHDADISKYPWIASLQYQGNHLCGATLISSKWALTSGDCTQDINVLEELTIRLGTNNISSAGQIIHIANYFSHPKFNTLNNDMDVGLLKLETEVNNVTFATITNATDIVPVGSNVTVLGWGGKGDSIGPTEILQETELTVFDYEYCNKTKTPYFTENMFCASGIETPAGTCNYDSGGPVLLDGVIVGIITDGRGPCADATSPDMFVKLANAREFITSYTGI
ncbi:trypsin-1-like [Diabrotica undecimpunctata]|uniref:trypsin-1-like n=1 Tax=Diabrotica undecimpunctata TaxID=50387 RepID=UPI003B63C7ED